MVQPTANCSSFFTITFQVIPTVLEFLARGVPLFLQ